MEAAEAVEFIARTSMAKDVAKARKARAAESRRKAPSEGGSGERTGEPQ
jgi:hypothetical protein